jgi:hypothetical protein
VETRLFEVARLLCEAASRKRGVAVFLAPDLLNQA